jgi:aminoglycoside 6-adenylyltransferase
MLSSLPTEEEVLARLLAWAGQQPGVRAMLLTSSRARLRPGVDALSDYDVILMVGAPEAFVQTEGWHLAYGQPLLTWGDQSAHLGHSTWFRGVIYDDYVKIDYTFWPVALAQALSASGELLPELDAGYRVLLDKDGLTMAWPPATYQAFRPKRPTAAEYQALVEEFWFEASYVAKSLWRGELVFARWVLDNDMKTTTLRRLLEWRIALDHGWDQRPGVLGRGLKQRLPPDLWRALAETYVGPAPADNWRALFATADLFRRVAVEVGQAFSYQYPEPLDAKMRSFLAEIQTWPADGRF